MRRLMTTIALAALAIGTAQAEPGGGKGNGNGKGGGNEHAGHVMPADRGNAQPERGNGAERGPGKDRTDSVPARAQDNRNARSDWDNPGKGGGNEAMRGKDAGGDWNGEARGDMRDLVKGKDKGFAAITRKGNTVTRIGWNGIDGRIDRFGLLDGCPPGLAKKNNGCTPPGLARNDDPWRMDRDFWGLRSLRDLAGYRYYDGSLVRLGPNGTVIGYYPLLGGALGIGQVWPAAYQPVAIDPYYVNYYGLGDDYRYFDGALYRLDPETTAIQSIAALLTGDEFAVGAPIPPGYDVYNVPYDYRDRYADRSDAWYRYSDGYVYEVDPKTQLIVAAIELLS